MSKEKYIADYINEELEKHPGSVIDKDMIRNAINAWESQQSPEKLLTGLERDFLSALDDLGEECDDKDIIQAAKAPIEDRIRLIYKAMNAYEDPIAYWDAIDEALKVTIKQS